jgi:hypothetical protein
MASAAQLRKIIAVSLAAGVNAEEIAKSQGISASYISNLKNDPAFQALFAEMQGDVTAARNKRTMLMEEMQDTIIEVVHGNLPKYLKTTGDAMRLFKLLDEARRPTTAANGAANVTVVNLPTFIISQTDEKVIDHKVNENNEVIEVAGRALVSQTSKKLLENANQRQEARHAKAVADGIAGVAETTVNLRGLLDKRKDVAAEGAVTIVLDGEPDVPIDPSEW